MLLFHALKLLILKTQNRCIKIRIIEKKSFFLTVSSNFMTEIFFGEVTIRNCRSLEIEEELRSCMEYLSQHMPADSLYLQRYKGALGAMHFTRLLNFQSDILCQIESQYRE